MKDLICKNILKVETIDNASFYIFAPPDGCRGILFSFNESIYPVSYTSPYINGNGTELDQKNQYTWYQELYPVNDTDSKNSGWRLSNSDENFTNLTVVYLG
jgi:hypothetical protein